MDRLTSFVFSYATILQRKDYDLHGSDDPTSEI